MFINPLNLVTYLAKTGGSAAFTKLREHFHLTNKDLKEHATPKNIAYGTFAASAIAAALIHPTTRMAICTLLSLTYTMSTITLNLMMIGLYLSWMGIKGAGSIFTKVNEGLSGLPESNNLSKVNTPSSAPAETENRQPPAKRVELGQEMVDEYLQARKKADEEGQQLVKELSEETSTRLGQKETQKSHKPDMDRLEQPANADQESRFNEAWNKPQGLSPKNDAEVSPKELDDLRKENSQQNSASLSNDVQEHLDGSQQQNDSRNPASEPINEAWNKPQDLSPKNDADFSPEELDDLWKEISQQKRASLSNDVQKHLDGSQQQNGSRNPASVPKNHQNGANLTGGFVVKEAVSQIVGDQWAGQFVRFHNQIVGDRWAEQLVRERANQGVTKLVKVVGGVLAVGAVGAVGVVAIMEIYQASKETDLEEDGVQLTSYGSATSEQFQTGTEPAPYFGMIENPLLY